MKRAKVNKTIVKVHPKRTLITTQVAAEILGITRPTLVRLLESGAIPFEQPSRHRRVLLADVVDYQKQVSSKRRTALNQLIEVSEKSGLYKSTSSPRKTR